MTCAVSAWWGYTTAADKQRLTALIRRAVRVVSTQQTDQTCASWSLTWTMHVLHEYRRLNIMYYNNCYPSLPAINMDYATEGIAILNIKTDYNDRITRLLYKDITRSPSWHPVGRRRRRRTYFY